MKRYCVGAAVICVLALAQIPRPSGSGNGSSSGGGIVFREGYTASSSSALTFTSCISSDYDTYEIVVTNVRPATNNADLLMQVSTDGGSTWYTTATYQNDWQVFRTGGISASQSAATASSWDLSRFDISNDATRGGLNATYRLYNPGGSTYKRLTGQGELWGETDTYNIGFSIRGNIDSATAVNAFKVYMSSGNIASGSVRCYGLAKQ